MRIVKCFKGALMKFRYISRSHLFQIRLEILRLFCNICTLDIEGVAEKKFITRRAMFCQTSSRGDLKSVGK